VRPVGDHRSIPAPAPVHRSRDADEQALRPAVERAFVVRLRDGVYWVRLDRVVDEPESGPTCTALERSFDGSAFRRGSNAGQAGAHSNRHVDRLPCGERRPRAAPDHDWADDRRERAQRGGGGVARSAG
jgi:hypothetical protein